MLASPDQQIFLTDPDSRSMATSGRGSGVVGYNVQVAVDTEHHLIVTHEVADGPVAAAARPTALAVTAVGGFCAPTWISRRSVWSASVFERQLVSPVSMTSQ